MKKDTVVSIDQPETTRDALTEVLREGAQKLIAEAVQSELEELLKQYEDHQDEQGRQRLVRNGYLPPREVQTGIGGIPGADPSGSRPGIRGGIRRDHPLSLQPGAAVSAEQQESGRAVTSAVPERHLDRGLQQRSECPAGSGCPGVIGQHHQPAQTTVGPGLPAVASAGSLPEALRLRLG